MALMVRPMTTRTDTPAHRNDRASVSAFLAAVMALGLLGALAVGELGRASVEVERTVAVADLSALAGAVGARPAAEEVAAANGAHLIGAGGAGSPNAVVPTGDPSGTSGAPLFMVEVGREGISAAAAAVAVVRPDDAGQGRTGPIGSGG